MKNKSNFLKRLDIKNISWIRITIRCILIVVFGYIASIYFDEATTAPQVCSQQTCFTVELARTPAEQQLGLMNRTSLSENNGMLFIFPKSGIYNFWMKDTLIPLDMLRIDEQFKVVRILTAESCKVDPCTIYKPEIEAKYVVEINASIAAKY